MGCGRIGARIAGELDRSGHSVAIIDPVSEAFDKLDSDYSGQRVVGSGFHRATLQKAGIENAYGFVAAARGDNSNIVAARTVRQAYQVERVVARISDPERAEFCERLGIPTVASVVRVSAALIKRALPLSSTAVWDDPTGSVELCIIRPSDSWIGSTWEAIEKHTGGRVAFVTGQARVAVPTPKGTLRRDDEIYLAVSVEDAARARRVLARTPEEAR